MSTKKWKFFSTAFVVFLMSAPAYSFADEWTGGPPVQPNSWRKLTKNGTVCQIRLNNLTNAYEFSTGNGSSLAVYAFRGYTDGVLRGSSRYEFKDFKKECGLPPNLPKRLRKTL